MVENQVIKMEKALDDESLGFYDSSTGIFTAPVAGRYEINLHFAYRGSYNDVYRTDIKIDENVIEHFQAYRSYNSYYISSPYSDSNYYSTQINMRRGQKLSIICRYTSGHIAVPDCKANGITVGCSFIQGRLVKRIY